MSHPLETDRALLTLRPTALLLGLGLLGLNFTAFFGSVAALIFLIACLWLVVRRPGIILTETRDAWLLWAIVAWCLLSVFWSNAPGLTLRYAVQLGFTFAIAVAAAFRLSVSTTLRVVLVVSLIVGVSSILFGRVTGGGDWTGVFGSKNALSQFSTVTVIAAVALLLDRRGQGIWAWLAGLALVIGVFLLDRSGSAGGTIATMLSVAGMISLWILRRLTTWQQVFAGLLMLLLTIFAVMLVVGFFDTFVRLLLTATGKDITLTGRTDLWVTAFDEIALHPILGQGFKAFWVPGNPLAEALWAQFGIDNKTGFHFHHTLISNAVEIGFVGVGLQVIMFLTTFVAILRWAVVEPCAESLFLAGFMLRQFILMNTEVVFFTQFEPASVLMAMTVVYATRARREALAPRQSPQDLRGMAQSMAMHTPFLLNPATRVR